MVRFHPSPPIEPGPARALAFTGHTGHIVNTLEATGWPLAWPRFNAGRVSRVAAPVDDAAERAVARSSDESLRAWWSSERSSGSRTIVDQSSGARTSSSTDLMIAARPSTDLTTRSGEHVDESIDAEELDFSAD